MKKTIIIFLVFVVLSILMTMPLSLHLSDKVKDSGDPLFCSWTLGWAIHSICNNFKDIFHANIFWPHLYTFAYSEHMIGNAIIGLPIWFITKNIILVHNTLILLSFILCGFGAYLLTFYLTKSRFASITAGIIYTFCPFRFDQSAHLHVLTAQWIPFALLYFHKYWDTKKTIFLIPFSCFFLLQWLCAGQNGLFLTLAIGICLCYLFVTMYKKQNQKLFVKFLVLMSILSVFILILYYPYLWLAKNMDFVRSVDEVKAYTPNVSAYLGAYPSNLLYGKWLVKFYKPEQALFPGFIVFVILSISLFVRKRKQKINLQRSSSINWKPFYWTLLIVSFLCSLGPEITIMGKELISGPFKFLHNYVPGFSGVRTPSRLFILWILSAGVLVGFFIQHLEKTKFKIIGLFIPLLIILEYISLPFLLRYQVPNMPPAYNWLKAQKEQIIIQLPMATRYQGPHTTTHAMLWSLEHKKKLINGYSGYTPYEYWVIADIMQDFPDTDSINLLNMLPVDLIVISKQYYRKDLEFWKNIDSYIKADYFITKYDDEHTLILQRQPISLKISLKQLSILLDSTNWLISTNYNQNMTNNMIDKNALSRWDTECAQTKDMYVVIDFQEKQTISQIVINQGKSFHDYPRNIELSTSMDGNIWQRIAINSPYPHYVEALKENHKNPEFIISFDPIETRFIKLEQKENDRTFYWSIHEITIGS